jgi:arsenate reductase-like glutaredoxin family protein
VSPAPSIQIFGFNDCQDTRKAQRFFAERRIPVHYVDLQERPASKGELRRFAERFGAAALIDKEGARYRAMGLRVALDSPERLLERALTEPRLLRTPLVRHGAKVSVGFAPADWQAWVDAAKQA